MSKILQLFIFLGFVFGTSLQVFASPKVVTSIRPIHSIASAVMEGVGEPSLLLQGATSPHNASLKPSQATELQEADIVVWIGPALDGFLQIPLKSIATKAEILQLMKVPKLTLYDRRGKHDHGGHDDHKEHNDHADHGGDNDHEGLHDAHIWLDPRNARLIAGAISQRLIKVDPANKETYTANAERFSKMMNKLELRLTERLKDASKLNYFVHHDAYQYFEKRFGLAQPIALNVNPQTRPGAATIRKLRQKINQSQSPCFLTEPQFNKALADSLFEGVEGQRGVIDPLGQGLKPGSQLYALLLENMADVMANCIQK